MADKQKRVLHRDGSGEEGIAAGAASYLIIGSRGGLAPGWLSGRGRRWGSQDGSGFRANDKFIVRESKKAQWPPKGTHAAVRNLGWRNYRLTGR